VSPQAGDRASACCRLACLRAHGRIFLLSCGLPAGYTRQAPAQRFSSGSNRQVHISACPRLGKRCWPASRDCPRCHAVLPAHACSAPALGISRFHALAAPAGPQFTLTKRTPARAGCWRPAGRLASLPLHGVCLRAVFWPRCAAMVGGVVRTAIQRRRCPGPARGWLLRSDRHRASRWATGSPKTSPLLACRRRLHKTAAGAPTNHCPARPEDCRLPRRRSPDLV